MLRQYLAAMVLAVSLAVAMVGCRQQVTPLVPLPAVQAAQPLPQGPNQYQFREELGFRMGLGDPPRFTAQVPPYQIASDLSNVANLEQFRDALQQPSHRQALARQGFVVVPADWKQMEFVYELNNYPETHQPGFVTTDSVLHTFHIFYDYVLRSIESSTLYEKLVSFAVGLADNAATQYSLAEQPELKEAAQRNYAFALVPVKLLGVQMSNPTPPEVQELVDRELKLIADHQDMDTSAPSPTVGFKVDYSQFLPRGHYTRSEKLKRYFMAMMWYGLVPVALRNLREELAPTQARQAALLAEGLLYGDLGGKPLGELWEEIYQPTAFLVGFADDNTPADFGRGLYKLFGEPVDPAALLVEGNLQQLADLLLQLREPRIKLASIGWLNPEMGGQPDPQKPGFPQFRVMGQRFVLDSYLFQMMVFPHVGGGQGEAPTDPGAYHNRTFPLGLDVMSILGSDRAYQIADQTYHQTQFKNYAEQTAKLRQEVAAYTEADWTKNIYSGWLHTLKYLLEVKGQGYPGFMQSPAWLDKQLNAALGSWAELRHDTILYAKQSVVAECGGGPMEIPTPPQGYVEPEVMTYWRLRLLATQLRDGLQQQGLMPDDAMAESFDELVSLLQFLEGTSVKQLAGQRLTQKEFEQIEYYGDTLARLNLYSKRGAAGDEITSMTDKDMAVVADVHTGVIGTEYLALEEGVGHANELYVIYPLGDKLLLGRGGVFSYYEFTVPVAERMTDEAWQEKLGSGSPPQPPAWAESFLSREKGTGETVQFQSQPTFSGGGC